MQELIQSQPELERLENKREWIALGRPQFLSKKVLFRPGDVHPDFYMCLPAKAFKKPLEPLELTCSVAAARGLWKRLPPSLMPHCYLLVLREGRSNCWRRSMANPQTHGWKASRPMKAKDFALAPTAPEASVAPTATPGLSYTVEFLTNQGLGGIPALNAHPPMAPSFDEVLAAASNAPAWNKPPSLSAGLASAGLGGLGQGSIYKTPEYSPPKKSKKKFKSTGPVDATESYVPAAPKPKLKIGIWS